MSRGSRLAPAPAPSLPPKAPASAGRPLDAQLRGFMEPRFGRDLSGVRLHTDSAAAESARSVDALAYTRGQHVVFGAGAFQPRNRAGLRLLAHELAHTAQPEGGAEDRIAAPESAPELEADRAADAVMAGRRPRLSTPRVGLHRTPDPSTAGDTILEGASPLLAGTLGSTSLSFPSGQTTLSTAQQEQLRTEAHRITVLLRRYGLSTVHLRGGGADAGQGRARAQAVQAALVAAGVPAVYLAIEEGGQGDSVDLRFEARESLGSSLPQLRPGGTPRPDFSFRPSIQSPAPILPLATRSGRSRQLELPPPAPGPAEERGLGGLVQNSGQRDDSAPHAGFDLSSGVNANYPQGRSPMSIGFALVWRNANALDADDNARVAVDLLHEPTFSFQFSPDPLNPQVVQAALGIINLHFRRHRREFLELSASVLGSMNQSGTPGAGFQAQLEYHLTGRFSFTAATSFNVGPHDPNAPPDRNSVPLGTDRLGHDWSWTPFTAGALLHFR